MIRWLGRHILSLDKNVRVIKSVTTDSVYYYIGNLKIRVSNHIGRKIEGNTNDDIDFVYSVNKKLFTVMIKNGTGILILDLKEAKSFITSYYYQYSLTAFNETNRVKSKELKIKSFSDEKCSWETFSGFLNKEYPYYRNFKKGQRKLLKKIFEEHNINGKKYLKCFESIEDKETKNIKNESIKKAFNIS